MQQRMTKVVSPAMTMSSKFHLPPDLRLTASSTPRPCRRARQLRLILIRALSCRSYPSETLNLKAIRQHCSTTWVLSKVPACSMKECPLTDQRQLSTLTALVWQVWTFSMVSMTLTVANPHLATTVVATVVATACIRPTGSQERPPQVPIRSFLTRTINRTLRLSPAFQLHTLSHSSLAPLSRPCPAQALATQVIAIYSEPEKSHRHHRLSANIITITVTDAQCYPYRAFRK